MWTISILNSQNLSLSVSIRVLKPTLHYYINKATQYFLNDSETMFGRVACMLRAAPSGAGLSDRGWCDGL